MFGTSVSIAKRICWYIGLCFPGTSPVEASVIGWEKDDYQTSLTKFSMEGILHCKQYDHLKDSSQTLEAEK
jgi:hypothetical protein